MIAFVGPAVLRRAAQACLASFALLLAAGLAISATARQTRAMQSVSAVRRPAPSPVILNPPAAPVPLESAAPATGVTGTIALPPLPVPAAIADNAARESADITPTPPFSLHSASMIDRGRAIECLTAAIYYEAAVEPDAGQQGVAQVILNRVRHPAFPKTVCGVVYQGSEHAGCQFSFACDGSMARRVPSSAMWARAERVAAAALGGRVFAPVGLATHYHTYAVTPAWNRAMVMTDVVGAHFFHRWKGYWGTKAAFTGRYRGREPVPGPHARVDAMPVAIAAADVPAPLPMARAQTPSASVQAAYRESGAPIAPQPRNPDDRLPAAATVLPQWRNSGQMLR